MVLYNTKLCRSHAPLKSTQISYHCHPDSNPLPLSHPTQIHSNPLPLSHPPKFPAPVTPHSNSLPLSRPTRIPCPCHTHPNPLPLSRPTHLTPGANILVLLSSNKMHSLTRFCAALFGVAIIGCGAPIFCVIVKVY